MSHDLTPGREPTGATAAHVSTPPTYPDGPSLEGRFLRLDPVLREDLPVLYAIANEYVGTLRWRFRSMPPMEVFERALWEGVLTQFIARTAGELEPAGLVVAYNVDEWNGICYMAAVFSKKFVRTGMPIEGVRLLTDFLFANWPLRKIYIETSEPVVANSYRSGAGKYFHEEGCLRDYEFWNGTYWDKYIFAIRREDPRVPVPGLSSRP